jgi:hypothetical protein
VTLPPSQVTMTVGCGRKVAGMLHETVALADGGTLTATSSKVVPVGDHGLPESMIYTHQGGDDQPQLAIEIQVWDGVPVCTRVELTAKPDTNVQVRPKHLKDVGGMVDPVIEAAGVQFGYSPNGPTGWGRAMPGSLDEQRARLHSVRGSRRKITPAFLERVAETYRTAPTPKLESLSATFGCSERSAARYVGKARAEGFLHD